MKVKLNLSSIPLCSPVQNPQGSTEHNLKISKFDPFIILIQIENHQDTDFENVRAGRYLCDQASTNLIL